MKRIGKNGWKLALDILMLVFLALMYNKRVLGIAFHEIGGLALCGLFIIHKLLNFKWIACVTKGLLSRGTPARQKLYWTLDLLLLASFAYVLVSGILISKVVFPSTAGGNAFKMGHYAASALALALSGAHVGLHMGWIGQRMAFLKKWSLPLRRGLAVALSVAVLAFGGAQITSTSFLQWLGNIGVVFGATTGAPAGMERSIIGQAAAEETAADSDLTAETAVADTTAADASGEAQTGTVSASASGGGLGTGNGNGLRDGQGPHGGGEGGEASENVASVVLSFASILLTFAVVVAWLDALLKSRNRRRRLRARKESAAEA